MVMIKHLEYWKEQDNYETRTARIFFSLISRMKKNEDREWKVKWEFSPWRRSVLERAKQLWDKNSQHQTCRLFMLLMLNMAIKRFFFVKHINCPQKVSPQINCYSILRITEMTTWISFETNHRSKSGFLSVTVQGIWLTHPSMILRTLNELNDLFCVCRV